jgi:ABC-type transport system involved in cytochrome bd biosynthesis fused ATPase/permease subunit
MTYIDGQHDNLSYALLCVVAIALLELIERGFHKMTDIFQLKISSKIRVALGQLVYSKIFKISAAANNYKTRDLTDLRYHNIRRVTIMIHRLAEFMSLPMLILLCCYTMYNIIGNVTWLALVILAITLAIRYFMKRLVAKLNEKARKGFQCKFKRAIRQIVEHAKVIKLNSWGDRFSEIIFGLNKQKAIYQLISNMIYSFNDVVNEFCHWSMMLSILMI